jgi:hypothetical protein
MGTFIKPDTTSATTGKAWKFMNNQEKMLFATKVGIMIASSGRICGNTIASDQLKPPKDQNEVS